MKFQALAKSHFPFPSVPSPIIPLLYSLKHQVIVVNCTLSNVRNIKSRMHLESDASRAQIQKRESESLNFVLFFLSNAARDGG